MDETSIVVFTPTDVLRRMTALGVIANPVMIWSFMRSRLEQTYPERASTAAPAELPLDEQTLADWLDDFLDTAETERGKLTRNMNRGQ